MAKSMQNGQRKRGRFAGACLSAGQAVESCQDGRNRCGLNGGGGLVIGFAHSAQQRLGQIQFRKTHETFNYE
jgi:hypothetical protein